jgi:recombination protein RecR
MLPEAIDNLAEKFRFIPGVGQRGSMKMSLDIMQMPKEKFDQFLAALSDVKANVATCNNCGFFAQINSKHEVELCEICKDKNRIKWQICLVEKPVDVITVEKSQIYRGYYHVLNNLISPLDNMFVEDTTLDDLLDRRVLDLINNLQVNEVELILFFKLGFAAQATTAYLKEVLKRKSLESKVKISRLAQGLPMYYNPETLDQATMAKALEDRREVE